MMESLEPVWDNASEEVLPFVCRKKSAAPVVSVIIPVFNVERYLTKALQSIVNQTLEEIEIFCVDDGSTDRSPEILAFFAAHDERITVITQPNSNAGYARNRAIPLATGTFLYFMDSDDWCEPFMLERAVNTAETTGCDTVIWSFLAVDSTSHEVLWSRRYPEDGVLEVVGDKTVYIKTKVNACNKLFRRKLIMDHDLRFQEITNSNDVSFATCAIALSNQVRQIADPLYFYRKSGTGLQASTGKDPYCFAKARIHCKKELQRLGLWEKFYDHFRNSAYTSIASQLSFVPLTFEQLIEVRTMLQEHFDYEKTQPEEVFNEEIYFFVQSMCFSNAEYYPTKLFTFMKEHQAAYALEKKENRKLLKENQKLNGKVAKLSETNQKLSEKVQKLSEANQKLSEAKRKLENQIKSRSYRLGRALTWLPRKVRGGVRCLREHGFVFTCKRFLQKIFGRKK